MRLTRTWAFVPLLALAACNAVDDVNAAPTEAHGREEVGTQIDPNRVMVPADSPMLQQIRIEPVMEHLLPTDEVVSPAKLKIDPGKYSKVLLPAPGRILSVEAEVGEQVKAGDIVATVDSPDADLALAEYEQARADVAAATAALAKAERDRERMQGLFEHDAVAKKDVANAESAVAVARAELHRAQAAVQQSSRRLKILGLHAGGGAQTIPVLAPIDGKVLEIHVSTGEYRPDTSEPLMAIANLDSVLVSADVPENAIRHVKVGEPLELELVAYPDERFAAVVKRIADTVDVDTRTIEVHAELANPEGRFRPEMFGRVRQSNANTMVPALPPSAIIQREEQQIVLVEIEEGQFEIRPVTTGAALGGHVAITGGVKLGERVVVDGGLLLLPP